MKKRFHELAKVLNVTRVDRDGGRINGVKLLGEFSANGRHYPLSTREAAAPKYIGKKVYVDHPRHSEIAAGDDRSFDRWVGVIESVDVRADGIYGNIRLLKESPYFNRIIEAATEAPHAFGMSHVADGDSRVDPITGREIVESISEVFSVDLVTDPATTKGLFESASNEPKPGTAEGVMALIGKVSLLVNKLVGDDGREQGMPVSAVNAAEASVAAAREMKESAAYRARFEEREGLDMDYETRFWNPPKQETRKAAEYDDFSDYEKQFWGE